jgi:hypothetical protein
MFGLSCKLEGFFLKCLACLKSWKILSLHVWLVFGLLEVFVLKCLACLVRWIVLLPEVWHYCFFFLSFHDGVFVMFVLLLGHMMFVLGHLMFVLGHMMFVLGHSVF